MCNIFVLGVMQGFIAAAAVVDVVAPVVDVVVDVVAVVVVVLFPQRLKL